MRKGRSRQQFFWMPRAKAARGKVRGALPWTPPGGHPLRPRLGRLSLLPVNSAERHGAVKGARGKRGGANP